MKFPRAREDIVLLVVSSQKQASGTRLAASAFKVNGNGRGRRASPVTITLAAAIGFSVVALDSSGSR